MKTHWEKNLGQITHYIHVNHDQVIIGSHTGSGHSDNASACRYDEFLSGQHHSHILHYFNQDVLNSVIRAVNQASDYPPFVTKRSTIDSAYAIINSIPFNPALAALPHHPKTEKGSQNYGNAGGYKTILHSDSLIMTVERNLGFLESNNSGKTIPFQLPGHASHAVASHDYFYFVVNDDYAVINPKGKLLSKDCNIFGDSLRITTVFRTLEVVCFSYSWFHGTYPKGWMQYEIGKEFTGRWEKHP